jgi:hypothetical protein
MKTKLKMRDETTERAFYILLLNNLSIYTERCETSARSEKSWTNVPRKLK